MKSFVLDGFAGGISDFDSKGIAGSFKFGSALDIRKKVDSLTCQQALTDLTGYTFTALAKTIVSDDDGYLYFLCGDGKIIQMDSDGDLSLVYTDTNGDITGGAQWYLDTGKRYLFWANATKLHCKELPGQSNWSDVDALSGYPKTNLTSSNWHTMKPVNGQLLICNGRYLALVGYDGSYTNDALDLIPMNVSKTILERNNYAIIGCEREDLLGEASLFMWDTYSTTWNNKKNLPTSEINTMIDTEIPLLQAGTKGGIYYSDFLNIIPILYIPGEGYYYPDAVTSDEGLALFGICGGSAIHPGVYSYGRQKKNSPLVLNLDYPFTAGDYIGSVYNFNGNVYISYSHSSSFGVKKIDTANKATGVYESLDLKSPINPNKPALWQAVHIITTPMVSGTSIGIKYRVNKSGSFVTAKLEDGSTTFSAVDETEAYFEVGADGKVFEVQATLTPTGNTSPEILSINPLFEQL